MQHLCKYCQAYFSNAPDLVKHFHIVHRFSPKSTFTCGHASCCVRFSECKSYEKHISVCHGEANITCSSENEVSCQNLNLNCTFPNCTYTCASKSTLRSHRFRFHSGQNGTADSVEGSANINLNQTPATSDSETHCVGACSNDKPESESEVITCDELSYDYSVSVNFSEPPESSSEDSVLNRLEREKQVTDKFSKLYLFLSAKFHIPDSTLQYVIESYSVLLEESNSLVCDEIETKLRQLTLSDPKILNIVSSSLSESTAITAHSSEGPLRSAYIRKKGYRSNACYVSPISHNLGPDGSNKIRYFHTVPIKESLQALFSNDSVFQQYEECMRQSSPTGLYRDLFDGTIFTGRSDIEDRSTLMLLVYSDDAELLNPIGSAKSVYKITNIYVSVGNLAPWCRTKPICLLLALTCREKDIAYFGLKRVLKPLIEELQHLGRHGVEIRGKLMIVKVLALLGDNLGQHIITGYLENFSRAHYFCQYCEESRKEWLERWYRRRMPENIYVDSDSSDEEDEDDEDDDMDTEDESVLLCPEIDVITEVSSGSLSSEHICEELDLSNIPPAAELRTEASYDACVRKLERSQIESWKGIVANCEFNSIDGFHCVKKSAPCMPHDIMEGLLTHDVKLALQKLSERFNISATFINRRIQMFPFKGTDRLDRPSYVGSTMKISGNAVQNFVFLHFLPMFIGDKIKDKKDKVWRMVLLLRHIVIILNSPVISASSLPRLRRLIRSYLHLRTTLFPDMPLRPKHHFLEHYPELIEIYGPLKCVSTLGFERKHSFFKDIIRSKKCCKNVTKILAEEHETMVSALRSETLVENWPIIFDSDVTDVKEILPVIVNSLSLFFGNEAFKSLVFGRKLTFRGTSYVDGSTVVVDSKNWLDIKLCLIKALCIRGNECYAAGFLCHAHELHGLGIHEVTIMSQVKIVNISRLLDYSSYNLYEWNGKEVVVLKHLI